MSREKLIFFDVEPAGLDPWRPILQIGAVAVDVATFGELEAFECKLKFNERQATRKSLEKAHYCPAIWKREAVAPKVAAREFKRFLGRHATKDAKGPHGRFLRAELAAHCPELVDEPFLDRLYASVGMSWPAWPVVSCTRQLALWFFRLHHLSPPDSNDLETLCQYFAVPFERHRAHDGLYDATRLMLLVRAMREENVLAARQVA